MRDPSRIVGLDLCRGLSAAIVCAGHLRAVTFVSYADVENVNVAVRALYTATAFGHQAVMVFFVLSGYFVGGSVLRGGLRFSFLRYAIARLTRLWVVVVPALALTAAVGILLKRIAPTVLAGAFFTTWNLGPSPGAYSDSPTTLLANLFFLQTVVAPVYGVNMPLWSLANEFWYYALFPLLAIAFGFVADCSRRVMRAAALTVFVAIATAMPAAMRIGFAVWLLGVFAWWTATRIEKKRRFWSLLIALGALSSALAFCKSASLQARLPLSSDVAVGLATAALCVVLAAWPTGKGERDLLSWERAAVFLSDYSFSLYVTHFPIVIIVGASVYRGTRMQPEASAIGVFILWLLLLNFGGVVFWVLIERNTHRVRAFATRFLQPGRVPTTRFVRS